MKKKIKEKSGVTEKGVISGRDSWLYSRIEATTLFYPAVDGADKQIIKSRPKINKGSQSSNGRIRRSIPLPAMLSIPFVPDGP